MSDATTYNRVVLFVPGSSDDDSGDDGGGSDGTPLAILLDRPWKITAGLKPDINTATCTYVEFAKLGDTIACTGEVQFCFSSASSPDVTIEDIDLVDAQPIDWRIPQGQSSAIAVKYRLIFADSRRQFVRPLGGRLKVGLVNPSSPCPTDPSYSSPPQPQTMAQLVKICLTAMGQQSITVPDLSGVQAPQDLKWFGTHAPSELEKLLAIGNCVFCLQADGTFTIKAVGDGAQPTIPGKMQLPTTTLSGVDGRGKSVIFTSYPTQVAYTYTQDKLPSDAFRIAYPDKTGAWQQIDSSGIFQSNAITEMNANFKNTPSPIDQYFCYRYLQVDPSYFDPVASPILRRTWAEPSDSNNGTGGGGDAISAGNPTLGLPPQVDIQLQAKIAVQNPQTGLWTMPTANSGFTVVPFLAKNDQNAFTTAYRLVKLNSGVTSTANLEANCSSIDLTADIKIRLSFGGSSYDGDKQLYTPEYYAIGYTSDGDTLTGEDAQDATTDPDDDTIVIPLAELQALVFNTKASDNGDTVSNDSQLQAYCQALSKRYLQDSTTPAQIQSGAGFIPYTIDGIVGEVEIDQRAVMTRFHVSTWFRPTGSYLASEFRRLVEHHHESHPHEGKTQGKRTAMDQAGSNQPSVQLQAFNAPAGFGPFIACNVTMDGGTYGSTTTTCNATYTAKDLGGGNIPDGSNKTSTKKSPLWNVRLPSMPYAAPNSSDICMGAYDTASPPNFHLLYVTEVPPTVTGCTT